MALYTTSPNRQIFKAYEYEKNVVTPIVVMCDNNAHEKQTNRKVRICLHW